MIREEQNGSVNHTNNDAIEEKSQASHQPPAAPAASQPPGIEPGIDYIWGSDQDEWTGEPGEHRENSE